jgi:hypothetical protein
MLGELCIALLSSIFTVDVPYTPTNGPYSSNLIRPSPFEQFVYTELAYGSQSFNVSVDTGSSDTWVVSTDFTCLIKQVPQPQKACNLGSLYDIEGNFTEIPGEQLHARYEPMVATGFPGIVPVTVAGLTIDAKVSVVTNLVNNFLMLVELG